MKTLVNAKMYLRYLKKVVYLRFLKIWKGLDFTGRIESNNKELRGYEGCYPIITILDQLQISPSDSILDIGCGKGLFLYYALKYGFSKVDGIEYVEGLANTATQNMKIIGDNRGHVYHIDARSFRDYDKYNFFFINNPFSADLMRNLADILVGNFMRNQKRLTVIYQFPFGRRIFEERGFVIEYDDFPNIVLTIG